METNQIFHIVLIVLLLVNLGVSIAALKKTSKDNYEEPLDDWH